MTPIWCGAVSNPGDAALACGGVGCGAAIEAGADLGMGTSRVDVPPAPFRRTTSFMSPVSTISSSHELPSMIFKISAISS
jgi:hypothetical protein